jgi:predicted enzyme related to lactoylglutathione lyase
MAAPAVAWFDVTGKDGPALEKVERLGGRTIVPPTTIEQFGLTFAFFADPEGHVVGLSKRAVQ